MDDWYAPAYTERMDSILLLATDVTSALPTRFNGSPDTPTAVQAEMAKALHSRVHVRVLVDISSTQRTNFEAALSRIGVSLPTENISFINVTHCRRRRNLPQQGPVANLPARGIDRLPDLL